MEQLSDPDDPRLDPFRAVRVNERALRRDGLVLVESPQPVQRALTRGHRVVAVAVTPATLPLLAGTALPEATYLLDQDALDAAVGFNLHRGVLAIVAEPPPLTLADLLGRPGVLLILEGLNDAENLGVLFRSAAGLGAAGVALCPRCADPLSRRTTRVSIATTLDVPFARIDPWPEGLAPLTAAGYELLALTPGGDRVLGDRPGDRVAVLLGAEGPGLSSDALALATSRIRIPMADDVDSLNVATAAAIALWALR
jgi:tRNA G18 (ribose-2'-O)-methylase SpoU